MAGDAGSDALRDPGGEDDAKLRTLELELARAERAVEEARNPTGFMAGGRWTRWLALVYAISAVLNFLDGDMIGTAIWVLMTPFILWLGWTPNPLVGVLEEEVEERAEALERWVEAHPGARPLSPLARAELLPAPRRDLRAARTPIWILLGIMLVLIVVSIRAAGGESDLIAWVSGLLAAAAGGGAALVAFRSHIRQVEDSGTDFALKRRQPQSSDEPSDPLLP